MSANLAQVLHFGVFTLALIAWVILELSGKAQGSANDVLIAIIAGAGGAGSGFYMGSKSND